MFENEIIVQQHNLALSVLKNYGDFMMHILMEEMFWILHTNSVTAKLIF